jgi:cyclohexanecarboxylate-CoA ligase
MRCAKCWMRTAKFKVPEQVVVWDALPKNDAGKVLKHQIRAALTKVDV